MVCYERRLTCCIIRPILGPCRLLLPDAIDSPSMELADFAGRGLAAPFAVASEVCVARRPLRATRCQTTGMTTKMTLALATSAP